MIERDIDDDEIEKIKKVVEGEGYEAVMADVSEIRKKSYDKFYAWYGNKTKMTPHQINELLVKTGIDAYNNMVRPDNKCKDINDVMNDMSEEINMSFVDTLGAMQDRGLMVILQQNGYDNAVDFCEESG